MALNKRKVLDSARKLAQKGAKAKALKEYQLLLQADPRDAKLLLEVGDTYRRWGQNEDAIAQYAKVAQQYRQDGFDARAVAVYKQILNLDPKHYAAYVSLSELYQRMGLDGEAIGALQTAAEGYQREGRKADALELLRQMAALDPTNVTNRLKVAELLRQEKMPAEALAEYEAAARELENQQDRDQLIVVRERILQLKPDHLGSLVGMVRLLMVAGQLDRAEPFAALAVSASNEPAQYELLIELYAQMGNDAKLAEATRGLAKLYRDRGDEDKARELMQRLPSDEVGARSRFAVDVSEVDEPAIDDEELLDDDPFITVSGSKAKPVLTLGEEELELDDEAEIQLEIPSKPATSSPAKSSSAPAAATRAPEPAPEGDPDQLFAEASVYLRYGKRAQAIQTLRSILDQDPNHRAALEKLGEAHVDEGQPAEAVTLWLRAASLIQKAGDTKALSIIRDRIATLDPAAAESLRGPAAPAPSGPATGPTRASAPSAPPARGQADKTAEAEVELDFEVDLDLETGASSEPIEASSASSLSELATPDTNDAADDDGGFEFELDASALSDSGDAEEEGLSAEALGERASDVLAADLDTEADPSASLSRAGTTTTTARIQEELEEAEFYIAQEMYDEAERILARILELAPGHPSALLRMGEVQVARGAAPDAAPVAPEPRTKAGRKQAGTSPLDLGSTTRFDDGIDLSSSGLDDDEALVTTDPGESTLTESSDESAADSTSGFALELDLDSDADGDADGEAGLAAGIDVDVEAEVEAGPAAQSAPSLELAVDVDTDGDSASESDTAPVSDAVFSVEAEVDDDAVVETEADAGTDAEIETEAEAPRAAASAPSGDAFDLRAALADVFEDGDASQRGRSASSVLSTVEDGFASIFSDFKKGVSATLDQGDVDTRYDLGIAYREMGLFEDAIGEFTICLETPSRRFDSLYLMGLCARDLGRPADAVHHFEQALALPEVPDERMAGVYFELAVSQVAIGDRDRARANLRRVLELDAAFPNAAETLAELDSGAAAGPELATAAAGGRSGFESFDDLFSEDADSEPVGESFESFDGVVSDVSPVASASPESTAPEPPAAEAPPTTETNEKSSRKPGRKKITFV